MARNNADIEGMGYEDGAEAARESGSDVAPADGWDGWTINAIGFQAFFALFDLDFHTALLGADNPTFWQDVPVLAEAAAAYARGAQRGATEALAECAECDPA